MRSLPFWLVVLAVLYLQPRSLSYAYWKARLSPRAAQQQDSIGPPAAPREGRGGTRRQRPLRVRPRADRKPPPAPANEEAPKREARGRSSRLSVGDSIDGFQGVAVYYNGSTRNVVGRHVAPDGYNLGLKYQCVEFVKRYYYQRFDHRMPNPWGHARDFFQAGLTDGQWNADRALLQFTNGSSSPPQVHDILVFRGKTARGFGHVAIVTRVTRDRVYIIQQNTGAPRNSRASYRLTQRDGTWRIRQGRVLGWLGRRAPQPSRSCASIWIQSSGGRSG